MFEAKPDPRTQTDRSRAINAARALRRDLLRAVQLLRLLLGAQHRPNRHCGAVGRLLQHLDVGRPSRYSRYQKAMRGARLRRRREGLAMPLRAAHLAAELALHDGPAQPRTLSANRVSHHQNSPADHLTDHPFVPENALRVPDKALELAPTDKSSFTTD